MADSVASEATKRTVPLYAVTIQDSVAGGNLHKMKELSAEAQRQLSKHDAIRAALGELNTAIAKAEGKG